MPNSTKVLASWQVTDWRHWWLAAAPRKRACSPKLIALLLARKKVILIGLGALMYGAAKRFGTKKGG